MLSCHVIMIIKIQYRYTYWIYWKKVAENYILIQYSMPWRLLMEPWIISNKTRVFLSCSLQRFSWEIRSPWQVQGEIRKNAEFWLEYQCTIVGRTLTLSYLLLNVFNPEPSSKMSKIVQFHEISIRGATWRIFFVT